MMFKLFKNVPMSHFTMGHITHDDSIEVLSDLQHDERNSLTPVQRLAISRAICALVAEELNLEQ